MVTLPLIMKVFFAIASGDHWRYIVNPWVGRGARPPPDRPILYVGSPSGQDSNPSGHATDKVRFARQIGPRAALAAYGVGFILGILVL